MVTIARTLARACAREGVEVLTNTAVAQVVIEDGRVAGVIAGGHGKIRVRKLVASSADLRHTLLDLVGEQHLGQPVARETQNFAARPASTLASLMFCLREPPAYTSARWDPDIDRCFHTVVGLDGAEDAILHISEVQAGLLPRPVAAVRVNTLWDRSQAPPGFHVAGADSFFPSVSSLTPTQWREVGDTYNEAFLRRWADFAPNMTRANVIADCFNGPADYERKVLLRQGTAQYRTGIPGLYLCGASTYPGGGVHGACGYNAFQAIAEDFDLPAPAAPGSG
jgi:phytoene dehydrogenase-like protein